MPYTWKGRDGQVYVVTEVTDSHLLFVHRLLRERIAALRSSPNLWVEKIQELEGDVRQLLEEITRRDLIWLPTRSPEQKQQEAIAKIQRAQEQTSQKKDEFEQELQKIKQMSAMLKAIRAKKRRIEAELQEHGVEPEKLPEKPERKIILVPKRED